MPLFWKEGIQNKLRMVVAPCSRSSAKGTRNPSRSSFLLMMSTCPVRCRRPGCVAFAPLVGTTRRRRREAAAPPSTRDAHSQTNAGSGDRKQILSAHKVHEVLRNVSDRDARLLGLDPRHARPEWLLLTVLPVPPPRSPTCSMPSSVRCLRMTSAVRCSW